MIKYLSGAVKSAKRLTNEATQVAAWQVRTARDKNLQRLANDLSEGKGYIIASEREMILKYPEYLNFTPKDNKLHIWCIYKNAGVKAGTRLEPIFSIMQIR